MVHGVSRLDIGSAFAWPPKITIDLFDRRIEMFDLGDHRHQAGTHRLGDVGMPFMDLGAKAAHVAGDLRRHHAHFGKTPAQAVNTKSN